MSPLLKLSWLLPLVLLNVAPLSAQTGYVGVHDPLEPRVQWDYLVLGPSPEGPFRLEVYYKLFNSGLSYRKENGAYVAEYEVEVLVYHDGDQVAGTTFKETYSVESYPRTLSLTDFILNQINVKMDKPGAYQLTLRLRDLRSGHAATTEHSFDIPDSPDEWECSRLEFARSIQQSRDTSQFHKSGFLVVPSVTRSYGGESQLECPVYLEVYAPEDARGKPLRLEIACQDAFGTRKFNVAVPVECAGRMTPVTAVLPVASLLPGRYTVFLKLTRKDGGTPLYTDEDWFEILWSMYTLLRADFPTAVEQLRYISSEEERKSLLETPDTLRNQSWEAFWEKRDPTPGSPNNEYRDEFYRRLRYCIATFTVGDQAGWRTDRGMIYIRYGEPDEVEQHPFDMEGYPYNAPWQVWRYYQSNLEFVFVDNRGSGNYELQYPYDGEYWRRN